MKFSEKWLREWVNPPVSTAELAEQLTMAGLEVEEIQDCRTGFSDVVIARVSAVVKHPDSDRLSVCEVHDSGNTFQVVCGAANVRVDGIYPFARIGSVLPGDVRIKKTKIKGVESEGMLCSGAELALTDDAEGIMELDSDAPIGAALQDYLELEDKIIELSLTPNRGDCLSIQGIARDVGVINKLAVNQVEISPVKAVIDRTFKVTLKAPEGCPRYVGRVIEGIAPSRKSPTWLVEKLRRSGVRSINTVVDITNYVMLELGQPMHAFDLDLLKGGITVRYARKNEKLTMLDGTQAELQDGTLVIADDVHAVAMAGIMGGLDSGVTGDTTDVFLESAYFTPETIMGRARKYGLHTDSSHRFERGVDYGLQALAVERATQLITDLCGGNAGPVIDITDTRHLPAKKQVSLRRDRVSGLLGTHIDDANISDILQRLGMDITETTTGWDVIPPSFRFDISLEADLIEEIARVYGYDQVPTAPINANLKIHSSDNSININELKNILVNRGYHEAMTYSFVDNEWQNTVCSAADKAIPLLNPISSELAVMRQSLWPGLLNALQYNLKRQQNRVRLFEYGRVFNRSGKDIDQDLKISGAIYGNTYKTQWDKKDSSSDLYDIKSDVEALILQGDESMDIEYRECSHPSLHPGQSSEIIYQNQVVGLYGAIHPRIMHTMDLAHPVYVFEIDFHCISVKVKRKYRKISKFPSVRRDISILVDRDIPLKNLVKTIKTASPELLYNLELFDVYHGEGIDILKKSLALGLTFQASSSTLTDQEVEGEVEKILSTLGSEHGSKLRE